MRNGLEAIAEDGDSAVLAANFETMTGPAGPIVPGVYVVHEEGMNLSLPCIKLKWIMDLRSWQRAVTQVF